MAFVPWPFQGRVFPCRTGDRRLLRALAVTGCLLYTRMLSVFVTHARFSGKEKNIFPFLGGRFQPFVLRVVRFPSEQQWWENNVGPHAFNFFFVFLGKVRLN